MDTNLMQTRAKIDGILSGHGRKPSTYYPDLEPGNEHWNWVQVPGSCYKLLLIITLIDYCSLQKQHPKCTKIAIFHSEVKREIPSIHLTPHENKSSI